VIDKIRAREAAGQVPYFSFEYFPPRTSDGVTNLYARLGRMTAQDPLFVDFTWGAGGSTSDLTLELAVNTKKNYGMDVNMHMTCTNQDASKVDVGLEGAKAGHVRNICALRGDPPKGQEKWEAVEGGFECALDLVKHIREVHGDYFGISVAGYPEGHPDNIKPVADLGRELTDSERIRVCNVEGVEHVCNDQDWKVELDYLKEKIDAGGEIILTQLFYDVGTFLQFVRDCRAHGIMCPILPGIMPIQAYGGFKKMCGFCKTRVPADVAEQMEALKEDGDGVKAYGIDLAARHCKEILDSDLNLNGVHFYTLNLEKSVLGILEKLGLKKEVAEEVTVETENTTVGTHVA